MYPLSERSAVTFQDPLPEAVDVVVIGGGIIGVSTAFYLLKAGFSVLVCEKGRIAGEQSSRNWGWVRVTGRDADEVPVAMESLRCWEELTTELDEPLGFKRRGVMALTNNETELADFESWIEVAKRYELDTRVLTRAQLSDHVKVPGEHWKGALFTPSDGRAEPFLAVPAIARGVQSRGGLIREQCAVRTLERHAGEICTVVTEEGEVRASQVVVAGGIWSSLFLDNLGIRLPQLGVKGTVVRTDPAPEFFPGAIGIGDVFLRRREDGGYTIATGHTEHCIGANSFRFLGAFRNSMGVASELSISLGRDVTQQGIFKRRWAGDQESPFEQHRVMNPSPSARGLAKIRKRLAKHVPQFAELGFAQSWAGMIDATPDVVPVMDRIEALPGLFLATGFSGHGFGIGPGAGKVMAGLVANIAQPFDLSRFRFSRFSDGSQIRPGPAI